ncbi:hypothetical protein A4D02_13100 [Niastella koreensis]|uniref:Uncharacterized protein n=2 Tax=Niastella koreensis TaxID=354356 RepID=G8TMA9_NIAKG|nr:hypothetical protein [Niastella koreensis]AEW00891.1 hypothetical protein Niako_4634 [Niastella koreensis GR20-10]OQP42499.1 hypothetical protein A4D02_13100 [Niastella koreensis]
MEFAFKRYYCSDQYFSDINLAFSSAVKYDLYTDRNLIGTLITNYNRTFAKFRESAGYKRHDKSWGIPSYEHILLNEFEVPFVRITVETPLFKGDYLTMAFYDGSQSYNLNWSNFHTRKETANLIVDIKSESQTVFLLKNTLKGNFFSHDSMRPWEGTIEIADGLHPDKIFGFLLAIQLYYWISDR